MARLLEVESVGLDDLFRINSTVFGPDDLRTRLERLDRRLDRLECLLVDEVTLVEQEDVAELDLFDEQVAEVFFVPSSSKISSDSIAVWNWWASTTVTVVSR